MHGVKRSRVPPVPDSAEVERKKRDKQQEMIKEYTGLVNELQAKINAKDYSNETLQLTTRVLGLNPEFHTGWSMRRRTLLQGLLSRTESTQEKQEILERDLDLTNRSLKLNPKNYSVWEHRKWVLETMPDADWTLEIKMVEMYLEKDGRNFHSWDYRRYLITSITSLYDSPERLSIRTKPLPPRPTTESELLFTTRKISSNFSNFSAWHYRTKLLVKLWTLSSTSETTPEEESGKKKSRKEEVLEKEFELVQQAIWSDPNDQSAWLYHRWLIGNCTAEEEGKVELGVLRREIGGIEELLEEEPDSRWCLDSLVHYKRLLVKLLDETNKETREERESLNLECKGMLERLVEIDPMRANRYRDLELSNLITSLSREHSTPSFHPHVTLLTKLPRTPSLIPSIKSVLSTWKTTQQASSPFILEFEGLGSKAAESNYFQYLFAKINLSESLASLRRTVREGLLEEEKRMGEDDFFPHLSLMYGVDSEEERRVAKEIIEGLERSGKAGKGAGGNYGVEGIQEFRVGEVWCVRCEGKVEEWEVLEKIKL
ncbi:hypothetical protein JCM16303_006307 [Sporobolomyces ruberrimus]